MGINVSVLVLVLVVLNISPVSLAQSSAGCTTILISLSPCLNYITGSSSNPSPSCCSRLSNVVQSQPQCLCSALNGGGTSLGITVNQTQALALPGACGVQTPPVSKCDGGSEPEAPAISPSPESPTDTKSWEGSSSSKSIPTTEAGIGVPSYGSMIKTPFSLMITFFLLLTSL